MGAGPAGSPSHAVTRAGNQRADVRTESQPSNADPGARSHSKGGPSVDAVSDRGVASTAAPTAASAAEEPSELALGLADLLRTMDSVALNDLERLLAASVAIPTAGELRSARLGLMVELLGDGTGEVPSVAAYLELRARRASAGEIWPAPSTLLVAFGDWLTVVRAAMRVSRGQLASVAHTHRPRRIPSPPYTPAEVIDALRRFRAWNDSWPSGPHEWERWASETRRLAREQGGRDARVPTQATIRRLFGAFERAVRAAAER